MFEREQGDQDDAMGQQGKGEDEGIGGQHHCRASCQEQGDMSRQMQQARRVGSGFEALQNIPRKHCKDVAMRYVLADRHGPSKKQGMQPCNNDSAGPMKSLQITTGCTQSGGAGKWSLLTDLPQNWRKTPSSVRWFPVQAIDMLRVPLIAAMSLLAIAGLATAAAQPDLVDNFEKGDLNPSLWSRARLPVQRAWIQSGGAREGSNSLAIRVKGSDLDKTCGCQRIEIREAPQRRLPFGSDSWYAFSFRVEGQPSLAGSQRWVIVAWKQEAEGGPFLAQRFDEGVFHITLESGSHRVLLATSKGEVRSFAERLQSGLMAPFSFVSDPELYSGATDLTIEYGDNPVLPDPRKEWVDMLYHVKGGLDGNGLVEVYANGKFIVRAKGTIGVPGPAAMRQYLRLGHNRSPMPGTSTDILRPHPARCKPGRRRAMRGQRCLCRI